MNGVPRKQGKERKVKHWYKQYATTLHKHWYKQSVTTQWSLWQLKMSKKSSQNNPLLENG